MEWIDYNDVSLPEQIAQGVNLPAALGGELLTAPIYYAIKEPLTGAEQELLRHILSALLVPFLWLLAIKRTISRNGIRPRLSTWAKSVVMVGIAILALLVLLILSSFWISDGQPQIVMRLLSLTWIGWALYILSQRLRPDMHPLVFGIS